MAAEDRDVHREERDLDADAKRDMNRDPITGAPGAHPVGTGLGAAGGAAAGAAAGAIGGPIGAAVGGVVGALVGGLAGKAAAEAVNPTAEEEHWRRHYTGESYYEAGRSFDDYGPAYRLGASGRARYEGDWAQTEPRLRAEWDEIRGSSALDWERASPASRAAWERVDRNLTGADDRMGLAGGNPSVAVRGKDPGSTGVRGTAAKVGELQSAGDDSGDRDDVIDALKDLVETCFDGEYGFRACADQARSDDLKTILRQRAQDCRQAAQELAGHIHALGGRVSEGGSAMGAVERGWVAVRTTLSTYDDKAVLDECERGEDNALARYRKALQKPLPADVKLLVERQLQGVQRNHDQIRMLREQARAAS